MASCVAPGIGPQAGRNERLTDLFALAVLQVNGEVVGDLGREAIHDRLIEARTIGVRHWQVIEPVRPLRLFLPALFVDFRDRHLGEPVRSLHIARSGLGGRGEGGLAEKRKASPRGS